MSPPNAHFAVVERRKITEYLLNPAHPDNGGKAAFFTAAGFTAERWEVLADALRAIAANGTIAGMEDSVHGQKYVIDDDLETPTGRQPRVRTIWIIDSGKQNPRLVTAYPQG